MAAPDGFTWVDDKHLAAMAQPASLEEYQWLRRQGVQLVISLTEDPPPRHWVNDAGLFALHIPVEDMHPPSQRQIELGLSAIEKAQSQKLPVAIHCTAGLGRTGTMLACYFVKRGLGADAAVATVRDLRPGSIETEDQFGAVRDFARRIKRGEKLED
jgi:atypical dual specificity phosphatase